MMTKLSPIDGLTFLQYIIITITYDSIHNINAQCTLASHNDDINNASLYFGIFT